MPGDEQSEPKYEMLDPKERAAMQQALREKDREDLRLGRATAEEIHNRNLFLGGLGLKRSRIAHFGPGSETTGKPHSKK